MTHYRPADALCHWRHLSIIVTTSNVNGTPVTDEEVEQGCRDVLIASCQQFTKNVITYSLGMCWMQNDLFWFPDEWTLGEPYTIFNPAGYITQGHQAEAGCAEVGVRTATYDSFSLIGPHITYDNAASGLSFTYGDTHDYYHWTEYHLTWGVSQPAQAAIDFLSNVMTHEFSHQLDNYFDEYGLGHTMPWPDMPNDYRRLDNTPLDPADVGTDFLRAMFSGDIEDIATSTAQGCTAAIWTLGPPRKSYPR